MHDRLLTNEPFLSREILLLTQAEFDAWFTNLDYATCISNIGRKATDVAIELLPDGILNEYCKDVSNDLMPEAGALFKGALKFHYTMDQLNSMGFWTKIAAKAAAKGLCSTAAAPQQTSRRRAGSDHDKFK